MATERREAAERDLWAMVSRSGHDPVTSEDVQAARSEVAEANRAHAEAEAFVADLRKRLHQAEERETRLMAVTDMLIARDEARRMDGLRAVGPGTAKPRRSLLARLWRH
jgi:hypothetical protein